MQFQYKGSAIMHIQKGAIRLLKEGVGKGKAWISKAIVWEALHLAFSWDLFLTDALCLEFQWESLFSSGMG